MNPYQQRRRYPPSLGAAPAPGPVAMPAPLPTLDQYGAKNFYVHEVATTSSLAPGNSVSLNFTVDKDADFFWSKFNAYADSANDGTTYSAQQLPGITALITNTTSGRNFSSAAVPLPNFAGTAQFPFILPQLTLIAATASIQIQLNNITDNITYTVIHLSFIGIKAFR